MEKLVVNPAGLITKVRELRQERLEDQDLPGAAFWQHTEQFMKDWLDGLGQHQASDECDLGTLDQVFLVR